MPSFRARNFCLIEYESRVYERSLPRDPAVSHTSPFATKANPLSGDLPRTAPSAPENGPTCELDENRLD